MFNKVIVLGLIILVAGCASSGDSYITDYSNRSVAYGWLDVSDVDGNHMYDGAIKQFTPPTDKPYWTVATDEFEGGFLFYHYGLPNGAFKLDYVKMQSCLLFMCSNTYYTYDFGSQGSVATVKMNKPGVYYLGSYKLTEVDTGWFQPGKFNIAPANKGPTQKQMLEYLLKDSPSEDPVVAKRLNNSLGKLQ